MILVKPNAGLGNRMRVINSAINLSKQQGNTLVKVLWKSNAGMNVNFTDIFEPMPGIPIIENFLSVSYYYFLGRFIPANYHYYDDKSIFHKRFDKNYWGNERSNVLLNTCYDFYEMTPQNNYYHLFRPVKKLQDRINEMTLNFRNHAVGVHIRRTDNLLSIEKSKTEHFIKRMDDILENKSSTGFYLSTDNPQVENEMRSRYGKRIFVLPGKKLSRNSREGIEDAVIDMYCLSNTNFILGSYWSSFSSVAAEVGKIPLEVVSNNNG